MNCCDHVIRNACRKDTRISEKLTNAITVTFDQANNGLYMAEYIRCGEDSNLVPVPAGPDAAANIPGSCTAAAVAQRPAATQPHDNGNSATRAAVTTKIEPEYTEVYTPVPLTGTAGTPITTATAKQARPAATSAATGDENCDENGNPIAQSLHSTAVATVTNTVIRHVSYTADGTPTTQLETVKMVSTVSTAVDVPRTSASAGLSGDTATAHAHATPVLTQKVEMHTTTAMQPERYNSRLGTGTGMGTGRMEGVQASSFPMSPPSFESRTQSHIRLSSQVMSHAMPSAPSPPQQQQNIPANVGVGAGAGAAGAVVYGGMGWGFNTSSSNNNNNYGGNNAVASHGTFNSMGTAGIAAPTGGPIGPVVVPAPAPTPAPVVPPRPTATHSGFIIGTSGAADGSRGSGLSMWMIGVLVSALALAVC